ncbi:PspC domain-containing protein [Dysgonomonas sp. 521]|uniref:PspC domain-containing protein n=1 Tax=Dysgonomonas sp. 521 TaxID=2302932 RepID=UPI0013D1FEA0|nr:PspC domain-containing protein [Dysgonomonas sp. 521]NDV95172.1 PspC domain-containing protein [Dysgonomonas sp. 521]
MKKVIEVSIGGINFTVEDDAYFRLKDYLKRFEETIPDKQEAREVMEDVEARVAEIIQKEMRFSNQVVDMKQVQTVIDHLGEIDMEANTHEAGYNTYNAYDKDYTRGDRRMYRDTDEKMVAGVCSGLALYLGIDVTIIRVVFAAASFLYGTAILVYCILWIVMPKAVSVAQKLELRGYAPTAENIRKFTSQHK